MAIALRADLTSLFSFTRQLVSDTAFSTWDNTSDIQRALERHQEHFDYLPMRHDEDFRRFECRGRTESTARRLSAQTMDISPSASFSIPDFGTYFSVGYFDDTWFVRSAANDGGDPKSPNAVDLVAGTFVFSTPVNTELYFKGTGYNVWWAAADLLMETPDTGRQFDTARRRGGTSRDIMEKFELYRKRGYNLNRRRPSYVRG